MMALTKEEKIERLEERNAEITMKIWALGDRERKLQEQQAKIDEQIEKLRVES